MTDITPAHSYHGGIWHHIEKDLLHRHQRPPPTHLQEVQGVLRGAKKALDERIEAAEIGCVRWVLRLAVRRMARRLRR